MLEKFQVPEGERSRETCGSVTVKEETSNFLEKISGISATPAVNFLACKKGVLLKAGSSAITTLSTVTPPERIERPMFPISTLRPSAVVRSVSSVGLKRLASITNGRATTIKINTTITIPTMIRTFFITDLRRLLKRGAQRCKPVSYSGKAREQSLRSELAGASISAAIFKKQESCGAPASWSWISLTIERPRFGGDSGSDTPTR